MGVHAADDVAGAAVEEAEAEDVVVEEGPKGFEQDGGEGGAAAFGVSL